MSSLAVIPSPMTAGQKAAATRKARQLGLIPPAAGTPPRPDRQKLAHEALQAFERASAADNPDWFTIALEMKRALQAGANVVTLRPPAKPVALAAPKLDDHPVTNFRKLIWPSPVICCTFADGEKVRMSCSSMHGKPLAIARAVRLAIFTYQHRIARRTLGTDHYDRDLGRFDLKAFRVAAPEITECYFALPDGGRAEYDLELVNRETAEWRAIQNPGATTEYRCLELQSACANGAAAARKAIRRGDHVTAAIFQERVAAFSAEMRSLRDWARDWQTDSAAAG
jgi:hypothetical protein